MKFSYSRLLAIGSILTIFFLSYSLHTSSNGRINSTETTQGCTCHGSSNSNTSLSIESDNDFNLSTGETETFTITVSNSNKTHAGINISVKDKSSNGSKVGTLAPVSGSGLKLQTSELTHTSEKSMSGGEVDFEFTWTAPSEPGTYYIKAVGNAVNDNSGTSGDEWNWMTVQEVIVKGITLTSLNSGSVCAGSSTDITWDAGGFSNVKIELSSDGGSNWSNIIASTAASAGSYSWDVPSDIEGNQFKIRISDASDASTNDVSSSNFSVTGGAEITSQPESESTCSGENVSFSVTASGSGLTYQWQKNDVNMSGETQNTLSINDVDLNDQGDYKCLVSNSCGNPVESETVTLTVTQSPLITGFTGDQVKCINQVARFEVEAEGDDLAYTWFKDGVMIPGEVQSFLEITDLVPNDNGEYYVELMSPSCGSVQSSRSSLTVPQGPQVTTNPADQNVCENGTLTLFANGSGFGLNYQWLKDNAIISGATSATYTLDDFSSNDAGLYKCQISNQCGAIQTDEAIIGVSTLAEITTQPENKTVLEGNELNLEIDVKSFSNTSYQWFKDDEAINGADSEVLSIENAALTDAGTYKCEVTNDCGTISSNEVLVFVEKAGLGPILIASSQSINLGDVFVNEESLFEAEGILSNGGNETVVISEVSFKEENFGLLQASTNNIEAGELLDLTFEINLNKVGLIEDSLLVKSNGGDLAIYVFANGIEKDTDANISVSATNHEFKQTLSGESSNYELIITNIDDMNSAILSNVIISDPAFTNILTNFPLSIAPGESITDIISFSPSMEGVYDGQIEYIFDNAENSVVTLSGVAIINSIIGTIAYDINVYPLPSERELNISISMIQNKEVSFRIYNSLGKLVKEINKEYLSEGENILTWDLKDINGFDVQSGFYNLSIISDDKVENFKILIK